MINIDVVGGDEQDAPERSFAGCSNRRTGGIGVAGTSGPCLSFSIEEMIWRELLMSISGVVRGGGWKGTRCCGREVVRGERKRHAGLRWQLRAG